MELKPITLKTWKTGTGLVVTIPRSVAELLHIEQGDQLRIEIKDVIKDVANSKSKGGRPKQRS